MKSTKAEMNTKTTRWYQQQIILDITKNSLSV